MRLFYMVSCRARRLGTGRWAPAAADAASARAAAAGRGACWAALVLALLGWRALCAARRATARGGMLQGTLVGVTVLRGRARARSWSGPGRLAVIVLAGLGTRRITHAHVRDA